MSERWTPQDLAEYQARRASLRVVSNDVPGQSKYRNKITEARGKKFHSKKEAQRYEELYLMEKSGDIAHLETQVKMPIVINGKHICNYFADFVYSDLLSGKVIIEDAKGMPTPLYKLKKKLVEAQYGVVILET